MAKQTINQGTAPTGAGGDTFRTGSAKLQANDDEIYNYLGDGVNLNKLGTAAFKNTGIQAGNVMEVGAFSVGTTLLSSGNIDKNSTGINPNFQTGFYNSDDIIGSMVALKGAYGTLLIGGSTYNGHPPQYAYYNSNNGNKDLTGSSVHTFKTTQNTAIDGNGFIKAASPIVKLFADKIESNNEAQLQDIAFEKLGVGDYLIKGSSGFAPDGWYIETPKDANGNVLFSVIYTTLENGDISVKTYKKKFDFETVSIVADLDNPVDITEGRWIDIRLQELPQPESEVKDDPEQ